MPNLLVFRPADAVETAEEWRIALERRDGPSMLALSRQDAEQVRKTGSDNRTLEGTYVLAEAEGGRDVTLLAIGTEVGLAMRARAELQSMGIAAAVVSMPCWELFAQRQQAERERVLGAPRIGIEAAVAFGRERWLRSEDQFVSIAGYGASAVGPALYEHFGITVDEVAQAAAELVGSKAG